MKKLLVIFATVALSLATAADKAYKFTLQEPATVNGTQLKPGDYKVQVEGDKAVLKMGKTVLETPVKVETAQKKFPGTTVDLESVNSKARISEIHIGGTTTRLVFSGATAAGQ